MTTFMHQELADDRTTVLPMSVDQFHAMIEQGVVPDGEPCELLGGLMVRKDRSAAGEDPMSVGHRHALVVKRLAKLSRSLEPLGCHVQTQQPLSLPPSDEPEPDAAVVLGTEENYQARHPAAADVACVIEVADSSLRRDRTTKLAIYAAAGIGVYVIVDLAGGQVEVYADPMRSLQKYRTARVLTSGQVLNLPAAGDRVLAVDVTSLLA